ncbi:MAG: hypothetical protein GY756_20855, partial [bacterium]|nr:hypothetical protein [bacterium]
MKIIELVRDLKEKNINIESRDGELDIIVNENNLSDELLNRIKNNKRQLLDYLGNSSIKRSTSDFTYDGLKLREYNKILLDNKISDSNVDDIYNLTPLQEGLLFHSILDNNSLAYFEQISLDLEGDLDLSLFQEGWQQVVNLYDPLRTMFISDFRIPLQVVLKYRGFDFTFVDIREKNNKPMFLDEFKRSDRNKNFNLKNDPLFRLKLIQIEENQYTLILSFHHIILDGWCLPIIISRFMDNYSKLVKGEKASLGYNTKYSDYIYWLNNRDKETDLGYWKSFLEGYEDQTSVPQFGMVEYKGFEHQSTYSFSIDPVYTESLKKLADETCVTLNTMIQTIWGIVLSKYNGTDDVVFGSTVSGRPEEIDLIEEMVGLFINTIPVRIKADRDKSFNQLALEVQRTALESLDYHYSSLADIHNESELGNTLLDHILVFENYPIDKALQENDSSILEIGNVESFEQINYNFGITVFPGESLDFRFCYNPEKYNKESLERIASHIKNAISNILSNNDITVGEIDIIPVEEKNLLLY